MINITDTNKKTFMVDYYSVIHYENGIIATVVELQPTYILTNEYHPTNGKVPQIGYSVKYRLNGVMPITKVTSLKDDVNLNQICSQLGIPKIEEIQNILPPSQRYDLGNDVVEMNESDLEVVLDQIEKLILMVNHYESLLNTINTKETQPLEQKDNESTTIAKQNKGLREMLENEIKKQIDIDWTDTPRETTSNTIRNYFLRSSSASDAPVYINNNQFQILDDNTTYATSPEPIEKPAKRGRRTSEKTNSSGVKPSLDTDGLDQLI